MSTEYTLDELIDLCGSSFYGIVKRQDRSGWIALDTMEQIFRPKIIVEGKTPREAVENFLKHLNQTR